MQRANNTTTPIEITQTALRVVEVNEIERYFLLPLICFAALPQNRTAATWIGLPAGVVAQLSVKAQKHIYVLSLSLEVYGNNTAYTF